MSIAYAFLCAIMGLVLGVMLTGIVLSRRLRQERRLGQALRAQRDSASKGQVELAELRQRQATLRHDVRGILSPALLVADRLIASDEPSTRRAGEVVIRTVERAVERLGENSPPSEDAEAGRGGRTMLP